MSRMKSAFFFYDRLCTPGVPTKGAGAGDRKGRLVLLKEDWEVVEEGGN